MNSIPNRLKNSKHYDTLEFYRYLYFILLFLIFIDAALFIDLKKFLRFSSVLANLNEFMIVILFRTSYIWRFTWRGLFLLF